MMMTSDAVRHELSRINAVIEALGSSYPASEDDFEDICWLKEQRRCLSALLAVRHAQRGKRLVSLEVWRTGREAQEVARAA
ncbi:MAG TPA: hypothetical protein VLV50_18855 [Stellaceae bacterium]|nr:hypothetical protein [Stellaceae bacterium]